MARLRSSPRTELLVKMLDARIRQGVYAKDARLPAERELAAKLGFARHTVRRAFEELDHRGVVAYRGRRYYVAGDIEALEPAKVGGRRRHYAILLHMARVDRTLLAALEEVIRAHKGAPLTFNMESMDLDKEKWGVFAYLHIKVEGVFFLSSVYGPQRKGLESRQIETLPLPYVFLADEPSFRCGRVVDVDSDVCARKAAQFVRGRRPEKVDLYFPWPLREKESQLLQRLSVWSSEGEAAPWRVHFLAPETEVSVAGGSGTLAIFTKRLAHLAGRAAKGTTVLQLGVSEEGEGSVAERAARELAERAFLVLHRPGSDAALEVPVQAQPSPRGRVKG